MTSLSLLVMSLLTQPSILLAFCASAAHCSPLGPCCPAGLPGLFPQNCSPDEWIPSCAVLLDYVFPGARPYTCWASKGSCEPTLPPYPGLPAGQLFLPNFLFPHSVWYHQGTCGYPQSHHPDNLWRHQTMQGTILYPGGLHLWHCQLDGFKVPSHPSHSVILLFCDSMISTSSQSLWRVASQWCQPALQTPSGEYCQGPLIC